MRVVIAGGRNFEHKPEDLDWLDRLNEKHNITTILSGGASGADRFGEVWANQNGIPVELYPAEWKKHGRAAGPIRNRKMAKESDALIVFPGGAGTASMRKEAEKHSLKIWSRDRNGIS
jgi:hypothetical protein